MLVSETKVNVTGFIGKFLKDCLGFLFSPFVCVGKAREDEGGLPAGRDGVGGGQGEDGVTN